MITNNYSQLGKSRKVYERYQFLCGSSHLLCCALTRFPLFTLRVTEKAILYPVQNKNNLPFHGHLLYIFGFDLEEQMTGMMEIEIASRKTSHLTDSRKSNTSNVSTKELHFSFLVF